MLVRLGKSITTVMGRLTSLGSVIAAGATFAMVLVVTVDIVGRASLNQPLPGSYEIVETLMVVTVFLSFAFCEARHRHIRVETLRGRVPPRSQHVFDLIAYVVGLFLYVIIGYAAWGYAMASWSVREFASGPVAIPLYPAKFIVVVGCFLLAIQFLIHAAERMFSILRKGELKS